VAVPVDAVSFSPDGKNVATGDEDGQVRLWRPGGRPVAELRRHPGAVLNVLYSQDGARLATAATDGKVEVLDVRTGKPVFTVASPDPISRLSFTPAGTMLAVSAPTETLIWNVDTRHLVVTLPGTAGVFSPTSNALATAAGEEVHVYSCDVCGSVD